MTALPGKRIPVKIKEPDDTWTEVKLADGTILRLRHLLIDINRIEGQYGADGQPAYEIKGGTMLEVIAPSKLRKK